MQVLLRESEIEDVEVRQDVPLSGLTTFRIGGPARTMLLPRTVSGLERCLKTFGHEDIFCIGRGSNLLVSDNGVDTVLSLARLNGIEFHEGAHGKVVLTVEAGAGLRQLVTFCARLGFQGLEALAGIPASIGGALFMNAGAGGVSFCGLATEVLIVTSGGAGWIPASELEAAYRSGGVPEGSVVAAVRLVLQRGSEAESRKKIREVMKRRAATQPLGAASAGCVFRNFPDTPAGLVIDRCGLKGVSCGDAEVSAKHANFIVNRRSATYSHVMRLIDMVRERVMKETGRHLELEIRIVGESL